LRCVILLSNHVRKQSHHVAGRSKLLLHVLEAWSSRLGSEARCPHYLRSFIISSGQMVSYLKFGARQRPSVSLSSVHSPLALTCNATHPRSRGSLSSSTPLRPAADGSLLQYVPRVHCYVICVFPIWLMGASGSVVGWGTICFILSEDRATTQAVSRWLPTAAARVRAPVRSCGICGGQSVTAGRFSPSTSVSSTNSHSTDCSTLIIYHPGLVQ
jgi:hypothetical protein